MPPSPVALTFQQIRDLWLAAGGDSGGVENVMAGIALVESSGYPNAHLLCPQMGPRRCPVGDQEDSRGLWQINIQAHPQFSSWNLYNPGTAAQAAVNLYRSDGFGPWLPDITSGKIFPKIPAGAVLPPGIKGTPSGQGGGTTQPASITGTACKIICGCIPFTGVCISEFTPPCIACKAGTGGITSALNPGGIIGSIFGDVFGKVIYGAIVAAGGILILLGLAMIGVDIGLSAKRRGSGSTINVLVENTPGKRRARAAAAADKTAAKDSRERRANARAITGRQREERLAAERQEKKARNSRYSQGAKTATGDDIPF